MSESQTIFYPRQRRIRHVHSLAGRNIVWCGHVHGTPSPETRDEHGASSHLTKGIHSGHTTTALSPAMASAYSLTSSATTSPASSRAASPPPPLSNVGVLSAAGKKQSGHRRTGSFPHELPSTASSEPALFSDWHTRNYETLMKRSESTTSMQSFGSTTVEDSSITKSAYKAKKKSSSQPPRRRTSTKSNCHDEPGLLDAYVTLHLYADSPPFYTSEIIPNTVNPTFRAVDISQCIDWYDAVQTDVVARLWARLSVPESAAMAGQTGRLHQHSPLQSQEEYHILIEWQIELNALAYLGKNLADTHYLYPSNTLILELDDGFYTAPDIVMKCKRSSTALDLALESETASVDTEHSISRAKKSYTYHHIMKLNTLKDCIFDTQKSTDEIQHTINDILETDRERFRLGRERRQRQTKLKELQALVESEHKELAQEKQHVAELRKRIRVHHQLLKEGIQRHDAGAEYLQENEVVLEGNVKMHQKLFHMLDRRKKELIADLFSIYPIEQSYDDIHQFCIRGVHLPNSVYTGCDEESIAIALGFTAHLVSMLAYYLAIPLRYPITPMGSRATIDDPVSLIGSSKTFPLYSKGVDRYRFEFGVFLLNKDIEQLMNAYGLIVMDLRHTLPNIHYFIQAVLTTSIHSGPSSISVLSISTYANGDSNDPHSPLSMKRPTSRHFDDYALPCDQVNHLTLQPTVHQPVPQPSPSVSMTPTISQSPKLSGSFNANAFLSMTQPMAAPAILDTVTTSSCKFKSKHGQTIHDTPRPHVEDFGQSDRSIS